MEFFTNDCHLLETHGNILTFVQCQLTLHATHDSTAYSHHTASNKLSSANPATPTTNIDLSFYREKKTV